MGRTRRGWPRLEAASASWYAGAMAALTILGVLAGAGLAAAQAGEPDLAVSIAAKPKTPRRSQSVELSVTVTNQAQAPAGGIVVTLSARNGLTRPTLVNATPDTVQASCSVPPSPGSPPDCTMTPVPPSCQSTQNQLTCRYRYSQLQPAGQPGDSVTIIASAVIGKQRRESALASAFSDSPDANPSNNSARFTFHVRDGKKKHRR